MPPRDGRGVARVGVGVGVGRVGMGVGVGAGVAARTATCVATPLVSMCRMRSEWSCVVHALPTPSMAVIVGDSSASYSVPPRPGARVASYSSGSTCHTAQPSGTASPSARKCSSIISL